MGKLVLFLAALITLSHNLYAQEQEPSKRPNIIVYLTDDEGFHHISHYGAKIQTPSIDQLAQEGVTFTQAIASTAVCTPSRYSIMTGLYAGKNKSAAFKRDNPAGSPYKVTWNTYLTPEDVTVHETMSAHGYYTGMVGKWHLNDIHDRGLPKFKGNEDLDLKSTSQKLKKHQDILARMVKKYSGADFVANIVAENNEEIPIKQLRVHNPEWVTQGAIEFLDSTSKDEPFFLIVSSTSPHGPAATLSLKENPRHTPEGKIPQVTPYHPDRKSIVQRLKQQNIRVNHQAVSALFVNDQVAALQKKVKEMGIEQETVFIFASDHNSEPGKATTYDAGVRIPMLMKWPGVIEPGLVNHNVVQVTDIFPTAMDIAGIDSNLDLDGKSIVPAVLEGKPLRDEAFLEIGRLRAVRTDRFKYIAFRYPQSIINKMKYGKLKEAPNHLELPNQGQPNISMQYYNGYFAPDQLYDLEADPNEQINLAKDPKYAEILKEMKARLQKYLDRSDYPYDLSDTAFMESEVFRELAKETLRKAKERQPEWAQHVKFRKGPQLAQ